MEIEDKDPITEEVLLKATKAIEAIVAAKFKELLVALIIQLTIEKFDWNIPCIYLFWSYIMGYSALLGVDILIELLLIIISNRGSILKPDARMSMAGFLYVRFVIMLGEVAYNAFGTVWLIENYNQCPIGNPKYTILASIGFFWLTMLMVVIMVCCTYDAAGRKWVRMKKYQRSIEESELVYKRSSGNLRNWRQRLVYRTQRKTWQIRCNYIFCCVPNDEASTKSFADVARIFSDFFRDLDLVPSDIIAGLVLLHKYQKSEKKSIVYQQKNGVYDYMSGVAIGPQTKFMNLKDPGDLTIFKAVCRFTQHALWAYGWLLYPTIRQCGFCKLCCALRCCSGEHANVHEDHSCGLNDAALNRITEIGDVQVIYANYHVGVGQTPFFVALDHDYKKVVISIRGTLSVQDILTDLNGDVEPIPGFGSDFMAHKGMVEAATYVLDIIQTKNLIGNALSYKDKDKHRSAEDYQIVITGHSLGAGAASILGMMMKQTEPDLLVYAISPPGGLFSAIAMEQSKNFITSLVVGKDAVPRLGLHQLETLRADLLSVLQDTDEPKWRIISGVLCCKSCERRTYVPSDDDTMYNFQLLKNNGRKHDVALPSNLSQSTPMYPPGKIIHIVKVKLNKTDDPDLVKMGGIYQALWADNKEFNEVLISPFKMIDDHLPYKILSALRKVIENQAPKKPPRSTSKCINTSDWEAFGFRTTSPVLNNRVFLETSFTSLQSPTAPITVAPSSTCSSATNGYFSTRSEPSPLPITNIMTFLNNKTRSQQDIQVHVHVPNQKKNSLRRTASENVDNRKIDLIHDDWFGLAPLASPESLSEVSSISSRTSATNLDKIQTLSGSYEFKTPKVMRRTPKINNNLSTCADDVKNVRYFQRLGQISKSLRRPSQNGSLTNSSSNLSYESAPSYKCNEDEDAGSSRCCDIEEEIHVMKGEPVGDVVVEDRPNTSGESDDFQSVEDILDSVLKSAGCADYFNSKTNFLETHFDESMFVDEKPPAYEEWPPQIVSPCTPVNDPDIISNFAIDLNLGEEYRSQHYSQIAADNSKANSIDSGSICRTPSDAKNVTFNPQVFNIEEHVTSSPVSSPRKRKWNFMPTKHKNVKNREPSASILSKPEILPKTILCSNSKRRNSSEDCFSRTSEALPLLGGGLCSNSERTSPNFVRRKKYVYPAVTIVSKSESSV